MDELRVINCWITFNVPTNHTFNVGETNTKKKRKLKNDDDDGNSNGVFCRMKYTHMWLHPCMTSISIILWTR